MNRVLRTCVSIAFAASLTIGNVAAARAAALAPAPTAAESFTVGDLHVDRYGNGAQTLVLIPGLSSGPWSFYGTIAHFSSSYTIYALTLPGFDGAPATSKTPLFDDFATNFWTLLETRHIDKPVVIGHSLGGTLAFALAEQHPDRLRAIIAVDGLPVFPALANATPQQRTAMAAQTTAAIAKETPDQLLAYEKKFMASIGTRDADLVDPTARLEATSDPKAVAAWAQEDFASDLRPRLPQIAIPVLEIAPYDPAMAQTMGGFTQAQGIAFYQALLAGTPHAQVVSIAPSRHFAMLDQPDAFYGDVATFLASLPQ